MSSFQQSYLAKWEQIPEFSSWLSRYKDDEYAAFCKACSEKLQSRLASIKQHANSEKHKSNFKKYKGQSKVDKFFRKVLLKDEVKKAELCFCSFFAEHNIPFRAMDHLSEILVKCFPDSEIAKEFSCKRTKAAAITYNVLGPEFEKDMIVDILPTASPSGKPVYSIVIDESTDVATVKVLAIGIKYFSETECTVKTKFLDLVDLSGETADHLFNALSSKLSELGLDIKDVLGFAADTTNVMFGQHSGIFAKIKEVNPKCFFIKCVCHSAALSVSHACKILPRNLEQMIKEVYGYFSQSSKRQREFAEFQNFTDTENHRLLRHYDIRWLSLHACQTSQGGFTFKDSNKHDAIPSTSSVSLVKESTSRLHISHGGFTYKDSNKNEAIPSTSSVSLVEESGSRLQTSHGGFTFRHSEPEATPSTSSVAFLEKRNSRLVNI
ncbi:unnamed protein product [Diatraea saccharalis]|uniref:DUF4371 domain-containing protein n=1 Tax=Diatraea saccharalis TaxID=40085 RepID=A0A9N9R5J6_9NEOP|nr:unnamed protein product [Diatraea saccharalis]